METYNVRHIGDIANDLNANWEALDSIIRHENECLRVMVTRWGPDCPGAVALRDELGRLKIARDNVDVALLAVRAVVS